MNPPAARQVRARGGSADGFEARKLRGDFIDEADLILTATADQYDYVVALRPDAAARTFVLGRVRPAARARSTRPPCRRPTPTPTRCTPAAPPSSRRSTGCAARRGPLPSDDLDDPWGRGDQTFQRIGDEIEDTTVPFAALLCRGP